MAPVEKELVFDIDIDAYESLVHLVTELSEYFLNRYDIVRSCCKKAEFCEKCWPFITIAIKVLDHLLRSKRNISNCSVLMNSLFPQQRTLDFNTFCGSILGEEEFTAGFVTLERF